jgi:DNA (cytosine-5)-methyltransferase 1
VKLGSLCTGIGGLDLAVEQHFGAELAWCAEIDPAASRVLEHRFPGVPNIGNFVGTSPEPVDILCGGFPCQPVSLAGKRAGTSDDRWLFDDICEFVGRMVPRPGVLVFENVRGLLSANGGDAMARVVHGLARLGYVGSWRTVRASDVGAPHRRERVFVIASLADGGGLERRWARRPAPEGDGQ